jgi:GntR family transcriptional regulator / MocR family aminotransferase
MGPPAAIVPWWSGPRSSAGSPALRCYVRVHGFRGGPVALHRAVPQVLQSVPLSWNAAGGASLRVLLPVKPRAVFVTPRPPDPTGVVMAPQRRHSLLAGPETTTPSSSKRTTTPNSATTVSPIGTLQGLARDRVALLGSVSKTLARAMRLGATPWSRRSPPTFRHRSSGLAAGFHAVASLPEYADEHTVTSTARTRSIGLHSMSAHRFDGDTRKSQLVFGFGKLTAGTIQQDVAQISDLPR